MITLKTLHLATKQEVFDQVVTHLRTQRCKSISKGGTCQYRSEAPHSRVLKCAAGCLIADEEYIPSMERNTWGNLRKRKLVPRRHFRLIVALQTIHDMRHSLAWEREFRKTAGDFGLSYAPPVVGL